MEIRPYVRRIEEALGQIRAADRIEEAPWSDVVMREFNTILRDLASELQKETGGTWNKAHYQLGFPEAAPPRVLALEIALAAWCGLVRMGHAREAS